MGNKSLTPTSHQPLTTSHLVGGTEAAATLADENAFASILQMQWNLAQSGLAEIIKFGAMLLQLESLFPAGNSGGRNQNFAKGQTLKSWLREHCPDINYNTAIGYKTAAEGIRNVAKVPDDFPLLYIMDENLDGEKQDCHKRVMDALAGSSISLLKQVGRGVGRPKGQDGVGRVKVTLPQKAENALFDLESIFDQLSLFMLDKRYEYIDPSYRQAFRKRLKDWAEQLS